MRGRSGNQQRRGADNGEGEGVRMEADEGGRGPVSLCLPGNPHRVQVGGGAVQHVDRVHPHRVQARPHLPCLPAQCAQDSQRDCQHLVIQLIYIGTLPLHDANCQSTISTMISISLHLTVCQKSFTRSHLLGSIFFTVVLVHQLFNHRVGYLLPIE